MIKKMIKKFKKEDSKENAILFYIDIMKQQAEKIESLENQLIDFKTQAIELNQEMFYTNMTIGHEYGIEAMNDILQQVESIKLQSDINYLNNCLKLS